MTNETKTDRPPVTVIGLGLMGAALARALVDAGHHTTVWNRSSVKADGSSPPARPEPRRRLTLSRQARW